MKGSTLLWVVIGGGAILTVYFMTRSKEPAYTGGGYPSGAPQTGGMWANLSDIIASGGRAVSGIIDAFDDDPKKDQAEVETAPAGGWDY